MVRLTPYDPSWADLFEAEKSLLLKTFGDKIIAIEHIGSTAIPGLPAKPIIDINVGVLSLNDIAVFIQKLPELGYEYIPERRFSDRQFFPKGFPEHRTHHLNLVEVTSETGWKNQLLFRDYMQTHVEAREEYAQVKNALAKKFSNNRDRYTEEKGAFVKNIIERAKRAP
jgi:GrpB-like predicted nucleotidyltransferase (UPF0157 family)